MALYSIFVVNTAPGCDNIIEQQLTVSGCTNYIIRLASNSNALGPFDIYLDAILPANILYSAVTRYDMFNGVVVVFALLCCKQVLMDLIMLLFKVS